MSKDKQRQKQEAQEKQPDPRLVKIIQQGDADTLISRAAELGNQAAQEDLSKSQIRNIYSMVKQYQADGGYARNARQIKLLIPKLSYAAAKESRLKQLANELMEAISLINGPEAFDHFVDFFEAIVAYHYAAQRSRRR
jgi:CRISPR-associated protein Csm2